MVDIVPLVLLGYGIVSVVKPEWMMAIHRGQKATGTTNRPGDIEPNDGVYALNYIAGLFFIIFGLIFTFNTL